MVENILLLKSDVSSTYKRITIKKILLVEKKQKEILLLICVRVVNDELGFILFSFSFFFILF